MERLPPAVKTCTIPPASRMEPSIFNQARAMITWGDEPEAVRRYLLERRVPPSETDDCLALLLRERHREIRRNGVRKITIGLVCLGVSVMGFYFLWTWISTQRGRRASWLLTLLLAFGGYGIWKLVDGLIYLIRPQLESKAMSRLSD